MQTAPHQIIFQSFNIIKPPIDFSERTSYALLNQRLHTASRSLHEGIRTTKKINEMSNLDSWTGI